MNLVNYSQDKKQDKITNVIKSLIIIEISV